jgi:UDP-N-acetylmuramate--alanine ligase
LRDSDQIEKLRAQGAEIFIGHATTNVSRADVVIRSSAVPDQNVEVIAAQESGIPVMKRADFLPTLLEGKKVIAVAGTHGKSTITAMIAFLFDQLRLSPSYIIGSVSADLEKNAQYGSGEHFVIEADEYDEMFLGIYPRLAVVTSIEHDHPDLFPEESDFHHAFIRFVSQIEQDGCLLFCRDKPETGKTLIGGIKKGINLCSYGIVNNSSDDHSKPMSVETDFRAERYLLNEFGFYEFDFHYSDSKDRVKLSVPGLHNVENATSALSVMDILGQPVSECVEIIERFSGINRRMEEVKLENDIVFINDYAHHPTEIRVSLAAARAKYPRSRMWAVWQPHTYSRTRKFLERFASSFEDSDLVVITEIFPAREEKPADGFSSDEVISNMNELHPGKIASTFYIPKLEDVCNFLISEMEPGDVVIVLSAGDADQILCRLAETTDAGVNIE